MKIQETIRAMGRGKKVKRDYWLNRWLERDGDKIKEYHCGIYFLYTPSFNDYLADDWEVLK